MPVARSGALTAPACPLHPRTDYAPCSCAPTALQPSCQLLPPPPPPPLLLSPFAADPRTRSKYPHTCTYCSTATTAVSYRCHRRRRRRHRCCSPLLRKVPGRAGGTLPHAAYRRARAPCPAQSRCVQGACQHTWGGGARVAWPCKLRVSLGGSGELPNLTCVLTCSPPGSGRCRAWARRCARSGTAWCLARCSSCPWSPAGSTRGPPAARR